MTGQEIIIGIDAGTSVIKAVAFDLSGQQIAQASRRNEYNTLANGGVEQDMIRTWQDTINTLKELNEQIPDCSKRCISLSVTGQGDGTWLVDKNGEPVHDGWLWLDARAADIAQSLANSPEADIIYKHTATGINVCQMRSHLKWIKTHAPELIQKSFKSLHCKDWLYYKLTNTFVTDISEATFTFGDIYSREYSDQVLDALELADCKHLLPTILDGTLSSHSLSSEVSNETGLPAGLPITLGLVDVMCSAIGAGLYDPTKMLGLSIFGTTGMHMRFVNDAESVVFNDEKTGYTMPFPGKSFAQMQTNMAATLNIDWIIGLYVQMLESQNISCDPDSILASFDDLVLEARAGVAFYHPYISAAGERGPFTDTNARASWTGFDQSTTWNEMIRAVFDGLILATRDCYQILGDTPTEIRMTGGGSKSSTLRLLLASALEVPVRTVSQPESGAAGAAMLAAVRQGVFTDILEASDKWVSPLLQPAVSPNYELTKIYDILFDAYHSSRKKMSSVWESQAKARLRLK